MAIIHDTWNDWFLIKSGSISLVYLSLLIESFTYINIKDNLQYSNAMNV